MTVKILFYPDVPHRCATASKACHHLGYQITNDPQQSSDLLIKWKDKTTTERNLVEGIAESLPRLNHNSHDINKHRVAEVFESVFGYPLTLDPTTHRGPALCKSRLNASHDGRIVSCPIGKDQVQSHCVYQRLIDSEVKPGRFRDMRTPVFGDEIPLVHWIERGPESRFNPARANASIQETHQVYSQDERDKILKFMRMMGMDCGDLDILRDQDGQIYIVDANNTPWGPPSALSGKPRRVSEERMADSFARMVRRSIENPRSPKRRILILQSCDSNFRSMLDASRPANEAYARRHGYDYQSLVANCSRVPGTANWNRYFLLRDAINRGQHDWALWMDADAVIRDPSFTLESIIERSPDKALIACRGGHQGEFDINNGVFLLNLRRPIAGEMVRHMISTAQRLKPRAGFNADQPHLHKWLNEHSDSEGRIFFSRRYTGNEHDLFNYDGPFVCHVLRTFGPIERRAEKLRRVGQWQSQN